MKININDKTLYQLCIEAIRYAVPRNNHLEPSGTIKNIKEVLTAMGKDSTWAMITAKQLMDEIENELKFYESLRNREYRDDNKRDLKEFIEWLEDFIK